MSITILRYLKLPLAAVLGAFLALLFLILWLIGRRRQGAEVTAETNQP